MSSYVDRICQAFGGPRRLAAALRYPVRTVYSWRDAKHIPAKHHQAILDAATAGGVLLGPSSFAAVDNADPEVLMSEIRRLSAELAARTEAGTTRETDSPSVNSTAINFPVTAEGGSIAAT